MKSDVVIVGAGPAGLTAGYLLAKAGRSVTIIDENPTYVGGISRTVDYEGYKFDIGGHRFFSKSQAVVDLWDEILPDDFISRPRLSRIFYKGKFYAYPLRAFEAVSNLGVMTSVGCVLSYAKARAFPRKNVRSFEDWTINQFGRKLYGIFFKTYTEKVWGMPCDEMSADWAAQRIKGLSLWSAAMDGLKRSLGLNKRPNDGMQAKTLLETFRYPRLGPGMMWDAARSKFEGLGGKVLMGHALDTVTTDGQGAWTVTTSASDAQGVTLEAADVISSAPVRELMQRLRPAPQTRPVAGELNYRDFLTVALVIQAEDIFPDNWIYIHEDSVKVGRIQNFRSWSPEMVPSEQHTCIGLEYFCFEGDGLWSMKDDDLVALATRELETLGLVQPGRVVKGAVVRQEKAYPVYDDGYADKVEEIRRELESDYPGLHLVGRNGMHRYNNQDHAMMTAMLTVENILAGERIYDIWCVNEDAEYHEAGAEGDEEGLPLSAADRRAALESVRDVPKKLEKAA